MKTLLVLLVGCLLSVAFAEDIYKWVDAQGNVHYGDNPGERSARKWANCPVYQPMRRRQSRSSSRSRQKPTAKRKRRRLTKTLWIIEVSP